MGLFGRKDKNDKNPKQNGEQNGERIEKKESSSDSIFPFGTIVVDEVLSLTASQISIIGNLRGRSVKVGDELFLLDRIGKSKKTRILNIKNEMMEKIQVAEEGSNVNIDLEGFRQGEVSKYDVLSTVNCMTTDRDKPGTVVAPYLTAFLRERVGREEDSDINSRIFQYLAEEAILLAPCMRAPDQGDDAVALAFLRHDKDTFLPVFTDIYEMEKADAMKENKEKMVRPLSFEQIKEIMEKVGCDGLALNPSKNTMVIPTPMILALARQKAKIHNHITEQKINTEDKIMVAIPNEDSRPKELFDALCAYMKTDRRIQKAWYGVMLNQTQKTEAHLVILDLLEDEPEIYGNVGKAATPFVNGKGLNMQSVQNVGEKVVENLILIYERQEPISVVK